MYKVEGMGESSFDLTIKQLKEQMKTMVPREKFEKLREKSLQFDPPPELKAELKRLQNENALLQEEKETLLLEVRHLKLAGSL